MTQPGLRMRLAQMVDLIVDAPNFGVINFNVLHALLHILVREANLEAHDVEMVGTTERDVIGDVFRPATIAVNEYNLEKNNKKVLIPKEQPKEPERLMVVTKNYESGSTTTQRPFMSLQDLENRVKGSFEGMNENANAADAKASGGKSGKSSGKSAGKSGGKYGGKSSAGAFDDDGKSSSACCRTLARALSKLETEFKKMETNLVQLGGAKADGDAEEQEARAVQSDIMKTDIKNELIEGFQESTKSEIRKLVGKIEPIVDCEELRMQLYELREADRMMKAQVTTKFDLLMRCLQRTEDSFLENFERIVEKLNQMHGSIVGLEESSEQFKNEVLDSFSEVQQMLDAKLNKADVAPMKQFFVDLFNKLNAKMEKFMLDNWQCDAAVTTMQLYRNLNCASCKKIVAQTDRVLPCPYGKSKLCIEPCDEGALQKAIVCTDSQCCPKDNKTRYAGGVHTITTPKERVAMHGNFRDQFGAAGEPRQTPVKDYTCYCPGDPPNKSVNI